MVGLLLRCEARFRARAEVGDGCRCAEGEYIYDGCVLTNVSIEKVERPRGGRFVLMIVCFHF